MKKQRTILAFVQAQGGGGEPVPSDSAPAAPADPRAQPIAFPHSTHAGQFNIDCQYCHFSAERSVDAGLPSVADCMGCHTLIQGRNNPEEVNKLREYWNRREPIEWVRIYKIPDHAHFPHMRHVNAWETIGAASKEVVCLECHGQVQEIDYIVSVNQPHNMQWCIDCHDRTEVKRDCAQCHY
jgi:hypothetical protein